ncbi:copia protein [Tanacetum coccineum]
MKDGIFFNQFKYIKEMLKKFGLEDSKPTKTPMSTEIKLTKDDEADSVDSFKYRENPKTTHLEDVKRIFRYVRGTTHLGLWYPKGTRVETIVYADSDQAGDYVDRKSTSGVCTFMGSCLTSWFAKKQTALSISRTKAEYVSARKACQQALWMKQALIDYDIRFDDVSIMCDNKGVIDLSKNPVQHSRTKHKRHFKDLAWKDGDIFEKVKELRNGLKETQTKIDKNPTDKDLRAEESKIQHEYNNAMGDEENFVYQKAKVKCLSVGDRNNAYFYRALKSRNHRNRINAIHDKEGKRYEGNEVGEQFVNLSRRPIACCNVIFKCISKILTERMKKCLKKLVGQNQSAFIPNRKIQDNILISQELLKGYEKKGGAKRVALKIDLQKDN